MSITACNGIFREHLLSVDSFGDRTGQDSFGDRTGQDSFGDRTDALALLSETQSKHACVDTE